MKKSKQEWIAEAHSRKRCYFFYATTVLDLTEIVPVTPADKKNISKYLYSDITSQIFTIFPHTNQNTLQLFINHPIGSISSNISKHKNNKSHSNSSNRSNNDSATQKKKVCFRQKTTHQKQSAVSQESQSQAGKVKKSILVNKAKHFSEVGCRFNQTQNSTFASQSQQRQSYQNKENSKQGTFIQPLQTQKINSKARKYKLQKSMKKVLDELDEDKGIVKIPILQIGPMLNMKR